MPSTTSDLKSAATKKRLVELKTYRKLFEAAFDELHSAVVKHVKTPGTYVGPHHDYPIMSWLESGFPSFTEFGFYKEGAPKKYVSTLRPQSLADMLSKRERPKIDLPKGTELAAFLRNHDIGKRFDLTSFFDGTPYDGQVDRLVGDAVERYLQQHGIDQPIDGKRRNAVVWPLLLGTVAKKLDLRLVVPITMTGFEVDHFRLTETSYITRLPRKLQLARSQINTLGTGAVSSVVGAATHAFVANDWSLDTVDSISDVRNSLTQISTNVSDAIDSFFGALRVATGIKTGYAQVLWVPRRWALSYFCDLTPVYGAALRQYPSEYDNYGWTRKGTTITTEQLKEVRRVYCSVVKNESEAVRLALKRLNACLTRTDAVDAILDGAIGLELLLGDDDNQSLSYKLRLRAGALAALQPDPNRLPINVNLQVKQLYNARSSIVHGKRKKRSKKASAPTDTRYLEERILASDLLRFVLDVLLSHPEYQDPARIDAALLLGLPQPPKEEAPSRRRTRSEKIKN